MANSLNDPLDKENVRISENVERLADQESITANRFIEQLSTAQSFDRAVEQSVKKYLQERPLTRQQKIDEALASIDDEIVLKDAVTHKINSRIQSRMSRLSDIKVQAKQAFRNFSLSSLSAQEKYQNNYISSADDYVEKQKKILEQGIEQMATFDPMQGIYFELTNQELAALGMELENDKIIGKMKVETLKDRFPSLIPYGEMRTDFQFMSDCEALKKGKKALDDSMGVNGSTDIEQPIETDSNGTSNLAEIFTEEDIKHQLLVQMKNATSPEGTLQYGIKSRATQEDIQEITKQFGLQGGPADVTAYHDFYDLQIAFDHIWRELFDEQIEQLGKELYEQYIELKTYDPDPMDTISSKEQLQKLWATLAKLKMDAAEEDQRFLRVRAYFTDTVSAEQWALADESTKKALYDLATECNDIKPGLKNFTDYYQYQAQRSDYEQLIITNKAKAAALVKHSRVTNLFEDLEERLTGVYKFDVFEENSYNYGILVNYQQQWEPKNYQVGELVSTIPLAPKETQRYTKKRVIKKSRAIKEMENALSIRKDEYSDTYRDQTEIVRKATNKTNFQHNAEGGVNFLVWNAKGSHSLTIDSGRHSQQTKKSFREAVVKAAHEYKQENKLELTTTITEEYDESVSGEISNPNDEIPVTYLFYELQRVYEISEKLRKLTPVILVANDVPAPHEIDEEWLLAHDWILRRVILDDSYLPALDYLADKFVGDELSAKVHHNNLEIQMDVVKSIKGQISTHTEALEKARRQMENAIAQYADSQREESGGFFGGVSDFLFGGDDDRGEELRIKMDAAKESYRRLENAEQRLRSQLEGETTALEAATAKYSDTLQEQFNRRTAILRLRAHVKDNILYYMQAIWDQEPPDQRFFRLYNKEVQFFPLENSNKILLEIKKQYPSAFKKDQIEGSLSLTGKIKVELDTKMEARKLVEIAELDNLLGYKGNYMIFPLKENNLITLFMMQGYISDRVMGKLWDPDELANYTFEEMKELVRCYYERYPASFTNEVKNQYRDLFIKKLMDPYPEKETIIVPTDSLYIEALPGKHPILEDFKLIHRAVDVKKVQAEVRHDELENVRLAARVLKGEYEDPDIDKKIVVDGQPLIDIPIN
ncbi:MAG: hypothetical protein KDJ65_32575 [Anaerolineae bacterium]|nr:hypothetical protein [Anaerolineae bacterium]